MEFADGCRTSKCLAGYTENPQTGNCEEICGDGVKVTEECDDGNNQSGDGCSSSCKIE
jgi:cysteine-rich repeat protein